MSKPSASKQENIERNYSLKESENDNILRSFKEIYEFIKQNGFLDYKRKKSRTEKTPPKDSAKKSKVIEKEKKAKAAHKIKKIHSNVNVNNCSNSHVRRIEKNTNENDSNSTRNSTNLNHSKSKSSSRKKNKTPSASQENLNTQLHDKIIKNITETNVEAKRNGKFENSENIKSNSEKKMVSDKENPQTKLIRKKTPKSHSLECVKNYTYEQNHLIFSEFSPFIYKNRFLMADKLSLEHILEKIYFDDYSFDDIKEFVFPALRNVADINALFDLLFNSIKSYSEKIKDDLIDLIEEKKIVKKNNKAVNNKGNEFDLGMIKFEKFSKCAKVYIDLINRTYLQYRIIEEKSLEIEKIIKLYLDHFVDKNKIIKFSCSDLHRSIFVFFVYSDCFIKHFLDYMINRFKERQYSTKYPTAAKQLSQINEVLIRKSSMSSFDKDPNKVVLYEEGFENEEEFDEDKSNEENDEDEIDLRIPHKNYQSLKGESMTEQKEVKYYEDGLKKNSKSSKELFSDDLKNPAVDKKIDFDNSDNNLAEIKTKKKKKNKKNKKNNIENSANKENSNTQEKNTSNEKADQSNSDEKNVCEKPKKKYDFEKEIQEFEKRLDNESKNRKKEKLKPNLSEEWLSQIRQKTAKINKAKKNL